MGLVNSDVTASFSYKSIGCPVACPLVFVSGRPILCERDLILFFNVFDVFDVLVFRWN